MIGFIQQLVEQDLLGRAICLFVGVGIGLMLSDVREGRARMRRRNSDVGAVATDRLANFGVIAALLFTVAAAVATGVTNTEVQKQQADLIEARENLAEGQTCIRAYLGQAVQALGERSTLFARYDDINSRLDVEQEAFLEIVAQHRIDLEERRAAFEKYQQTLADKNEVARQLEEVRLAKEYPERQQILRCGVRNP